MQHLMSYQGGYRFMIVRSHCDFIVLSHWETRPSAPWPDIPLMSGHGADGLVSHSVTLPWHQANQSLTYSNNAERLARKKQVLIFKSLGWLDYGLILWGPIPMITQNGIETLSHSANPSGLQLQNVGIEWSLMLTPIAGVSGRSWRSTFRGLC